MNEEYERELKVLQEIARTNPDMVGVGMSGHIWNIHGMLRLIWESRIFINPKQVTIHLSPHQYLLIAQTDSIIRHLQTALTWKDKYCLTQGWNKEYQQYVQEDSHRGDWMRFMESATGPAFFPFHLPPIFSHRFIIGIRAGREVWCQEFDSGKPVCNSYALTDPQSMGLFVGAHLDADWYRGLPFTQEATAELTHHKISTGYLRENQKTGELNYVARCHNRLFPNTAIVWHEADELITRTTTARNVRTWDGRE